MSELVSSFFFPVPCWAQLGLKNGSPVLCPSLVDRVQWSGLPFIWRFRFHKIIGDNSVAVKSKQCISFPFFFFFCLTTAVKSDR